MTFENVEVAGIANALRGMRNPMMSHDKSTPEADEDLANIWKWRHNHRLPVWHHFCQQFIEKLPHAEWILEAAKA